ncbi:hypothetical protein PspLS_02670 [Pyricularia sp. CBS 133598]|nr:hypothetical protein PspLS_02670 [Pyricularia sp. CBS 133598]
MNQQQEGYLNSQYGTVNRSTSSSRPGYATTAGFPGGMGAGRQNQRGGIDALSQQIGDLSFYPNSDDRFNSFNSGASRFERSGPSPVSGANTFMYGNAQAWSYNGSPATINGAITDPTRMRGGVNRRAPLPTEWAGMGDSNLSGQAPALQQRGQMHHYPQSVQGVGTTNGQIYTVAPPGGNFMHPEMGSHGDDDHVGGPGLIKTAIVIKNIPFNVRKETLQSLMVDMNLPQPYAFNYHFDQGVFRGLAFANFAHPEETKVVINSMNGMDVSGRKLRVEYKKMLPEHERERIEREKREKRGQLEEQHRSVAPLQHQASISSLNAASTVSDAAHTYSKHRMPAYTMSGNGEEAQASDGSGMLIQVAGPSEQHPIDLNNESTLKAYMELYMFKNDVNREIMVFPSNLTPEQRRDIHILSHNLGLNHTSVGDGDNRQVVVRKLSSGGMEKGTLAPSTGATLDAHPRGLSRAATIDFAEQSRGAPSGTYHTQARTGGLLGVPGSPDGPHAMNGLRGVKSFADLRSYSPSPSPSVTSASNIGAPGHNISLFGHYTTDNNAGFPPMSVPPPPQAGVESLHTDRLGSLTRAAFDSGVPVTRPRNDGPGAIGSIGAIGSQRPSANGNGASNRAPERQPRGPSVESSGFGTRTRQNGHMQRNSDSSDNARTSTSSSTWNH